MEDDDNKCRCIACTNDTQNMSRALSLTETYLTKAFTNAQHSLRLIMCDGSVNFTLLARGVTLRSKSGLPLEEVVQHILDCSKMVVEIPEDDDVVALLRNRRSSVVSVDEYDAAKKKADEVKEETKRRIDSLISGGNAKGAK